MLEVIGNQVRTEILRQLSGRHLTAVDLAAELNVAHSSVHRHLIRLEEHGLVLADVEPGQRSGRGRTVLWTTSADRVRELGESWVSYATGKPPR